MQPLTIAFLADHYVGWMGGAQLLANLLNCVQSVAPAQNVRVEILLNLRTLGSAANAGDADFVPVDTANLRAAGPLQCLLEGARIPRIIFYRDLPRTVAALGVQVVAPTAMNLGADFPVPWFGYICDFQHQYLVQLFSQAERLDRDRLFRVLLENARGVYVTSASAAADVERFYPGPARDKQILRMPLALPDLSQISPAAQVADTYKLENAYLLSCSQRWMHKQHPLVLEAFAQLIARHPQLPLDLVFTGDTEDYRDPSYAARVEARIGELGLAGRVRVLGRVPRADQLCLIRSALAVVQASLFEGQPGASGTLEAALLGTRIIASDIGTNREMTFGRLRFFAADAAAALSAQMDAVVREAATSDGEADRAAAAIPFDEPSRRLLEMASGLMLISSLRTAANA